VDHFKGRILFVQVGANGDYHPPLRGVLDFRGRTDVRQLVRLVHHSAGVLSPVTSLMHLAAAVPVRDGRPLHRPCVVVAGGREPTQWEAYPHHQFLHTLGALRCCDNGGCWKTRLSPRHGGDDGDSDHCVDPVSVGTRREPAFLPRCMTMITPADVIRAIERYHEAGAMPWVSRSQWNRAAPHLSTARCGK